MKITLREVCDVKDSGSMGAKYIQWALEGAGYFVDYGSSEPCDVELLSVHHVNDYPRLGAIHRTGKVRIVGGHPCAMNPRPIIPFADAVCIGEGETWVVQAIERLSKSLSIESLHGLSGTILSDGWERGSSLPLPSVESGVPDHPAYLNREAEGHAASWYLELARGCPFSCHYCELGNTLPYRFRSTESVLDRLKSIDKERSRRVTFFAPDAASHPGYAVLMDKLRTEGFITSFGSMRIESAMRRGLDVPKNMLIRVGMDGLTEETRFRVGRKQTDADFIRYFQAMTNHGHTNFKIFMIVGYPWEQASDLDKWIRLMSAIGRIERKTNAHVRVKITPLIPQPGTPLAGVKAQYDIGLIARMEAWIKNYRPPRRTGWFFEQDGSVMSRRNWQRQCDLSNGDENILINGGY